MSENAITHKDDGSLCVPGDASTWEAWVSASRVRNYCVQDPILDWLSRFGEAKGFIPDDKQPGYDPKTDFIKFIFAKGREFEVVVVRYLNSNAQLKVVAADYTQVRSVEGARATWEAMVSGTEIISQAVLWNPENQTYGAADLLMRSDVLERLFPGTIAPDQLAQAAPDLPGARWHYRVIDIKFTTLDLLKDGGLGTEQLGYMAQVWLYNEALGRLQGYVPEVSYLLGRGWEQLKQRGNDALERLRRVERGRVISTWKQPLGDIALGACSWVRRMRAEGQMWQVFPAPSVTELRPNMRNINDQPWHQAKRDIAEQLEDLTILPRVSVQTRAAAIAQGITTWKDARCQAAVLGINGPKLAPMFDQVLAANRDTSGSRVVFPERITANEELWRDSAVVEFFVDFETVSALNDDFSTFPEKGGAALIFMIGCGYNAGTTSQPQWQFRVFTTHHMTEAEERRIIDEWVSHMREIAASKGSSLESATTRIFHWSAAEVSQLETAYNSARARHPQDGSWPVLPWIDLLNRVAREEPVTVRGAFGFGLKPIAKAMKQHSLIETTWGDGPTDGLGAMVGAWSCEAEAATQGVSMATLPLMNEIAKYNEVDCRVMMEILCYFRQRM